MTKKKSSSSKKRSSSKAKERPSEEIAVGASILGERGQIVIPKQIRQRMKLKPGSRLMVMEHENGAIVLLPVDHMKRMVKVISQKLDRL